MKNVAAVVTTLAMITHSCFVYAAGDSAVINISGRVLANTCSISNGSANQNVILNDIADRDIRGKGVTGGDKDINIVLKDCGGNTSAVKVTVSGNSDIDDNTAFANDLAGNSGGATGVGLYFYQAGNTSKFSPDGSVMQTSTLRPSQDNTLTYKASYVGTRDTVTAGEFRAVVNMNFEYQ